MWSCFCHRFLCGFCCHFTKIIHNEGKKNISDSETFGVWKKRGAGVGRHSGIVFAKSCREEGTALRLVEALSVQILPFLTHCEDVDGFPCKRCLMTSMTPCLDVPECSKLLIPDRYCVPSTLEKLRTIMQQRHRLLQTICCSHFFIEITST